MNRPNQTKYVDAENRVGVTRGAGVWEEGKWVKGSNRMVTGGNNFWW